MHRLSVVCAVAAVAALALAHTPVWAQQAPGPSHQNDVAELRRKLEEQDRLIRALLQRIDKLEGVDRPAVPRDEPPVPAVTLPDPDEPPVPEIELPVPDAQAAPRARAAWTTPDIAVIGNNVGRFLSVRGDPDRNRLQLGAFEITLQQPVYPGVRFFATLCGSADEGFKMKAEEAFVEFAHLGPRGMGGWLGRKRLNFGKLNPIHPHAWPFADAPAASMAFTGDHGIIGNGASLNYTLPLGGIFANLEVGFFGQSAHEHGHEDEAHAEESLMVRRSRMRASRVARSGEHYEQHYEPGLGVAGDFPMARLWLARGWAGAEAELGVNHGFGRAADGDNIGLTGLDFTLRSFPRPLQRLMLQGEVFWHRRRDRSEGAGSHTRSGHYALLSWRPDQYREWAVRLDNTRYPWPIEGREQALSLIWARRLTDASLVRLQFKHGDRTGDVFLPARKRFNELYLQFVWGAGWHTHPLN